MFHIGNHALVVEVGLTEVIIIHADTDDDIISTDSFHWMRVRGMLTNSIRGLS